MFYAEKYVMAPSKMGRKWRRNTRMSSAFFFYLMKIYHAPFSNPNSPSPFRNFHFLIFPPNPNRSPVLVTILEEIFLPFTAVRICYDDRIFITEFMKFLNVWRKAMETENPTTSSKEQHEDSSSVKLFLNKFHHTDESARNISIQTGEEFSPEFIRHRAVPRYDPSRQLVYEDLTGILGIRTESGISPQNSDINPPSVSNSSETDGRRFIRNPSDQFFDATCFGQISPSARFPVSSIYHPCFHVSPETFSSEKVKFLCSFGGKILLRPGDRKLRYVGGDTRIVSVRKGMAFDDLSRKTASIFNQLHNIKYQLPGEDLDSLISVASDEDLHHMMEEFLQLDRAGGSPRLRLFLIPSGEPDSLSSSEVARPFEHHSDVDYFVAVNGCAEFSPRKKGSGLLRPISRAAWSGNVGEGAFGLATDSPDSSNHRILRAHMTRNLSEQNGFVPDPNRFHHQPPESCLVNICSPSSLKGKNNNFGNQLQNDGAVILEDLLGDPKKLSLRRGMFHVGSDIRLQEEEEDEVQLIPLPLPNKLLGQVSCIVPAAAVRGNSGGDYRFLLDKVTVSGEEGGLGRVESGPSGITGCLLDKPPAFGSLVSSPVIDVMKDYIPESRRPNDSGWRSHDMFEENEARNLPLGSPSSFEDDTNVMDEAPSGFNSRDEDMDESISDATLAEIEAGIYGLQIIKNGDLEELKELGSGTFGTVYHGKWRGTDVAIKRIKKSCFSGKPSEQQRLIKDFWREAQILSNLHHPNVVAFYGVVPDGPDGTLATLTEFMVNGSLKRSLSRKDRALDRRKRMIIAMDAAFGMEYLHLRNIVHFDLKCDNLLVNLRDPQRPICKVGDFGLSRIKQNTLVTGGVRGTLPWMAPELLDGSSSRVSEKVDVFSFGVVMWELLTGEEPYANMHCGAIIGGIVNNTLRLPVPERCEPKWRELMEECWSHDPSARPSFSEITTRLRLISLSLSSHRLSRPTT